MNRLELSYQGHPTTFFCKICWKEQILPRNLSNLGKLACSYILFFIVERAYENRNRGDLLPASEYWEFFLVVRGTQTIHFPRRKFLAPDLLWSPERLFRCARLTHPAIAAVPRCIITLTLWKPNSSNINPAKGTTFGTGLLSKKLKRTNMLQYKH